MVKSDEFVIRKTGFKFWVHHLIVYLRQFFQSFYGSASMSVQQG